MPVHLTVRMAWHDNKWNGSVCKDPEGNSYCTGTHSLLTERLTRNKKTSLEEPGAKLDVRPDYLPPCFWASNAFGTQPVKVTHVHAFQRFRDRVIHDELRPNSIFSWPFRLSFNHGRDKQKREGAYPSDLVTRIDNFVHKFKPGESIVFYYLNYSNPVSADDNKYALVGCSVLSEAVRMPKDFPFSGEELSEIRTSKHNYKNFPAMNWAIQFSTDPSKSVVLPYQEYVDYLAEHPEGEKLLEEIKVLIDDAAIIPSFKYVAETLDHDRCIYLLYKMRKSLAIVQSHGLVSVDREIKIVDELLEKAWRERGLYPGLGNVIDLLAELGEETEHVDGQNIVSLIRSKVSEEKEVLNVVFSLFKDSGKIPSYLSKYDETIESARMGLNSNEDLLTAFQKLSLFALTKDQLKRILYPSVQDDHPFGGQPIKVQNIVTNPYLLCEEYVEMPVDLDVAEPSDQPIGMFTIDIGMFPDTRYLGRRSDMQNMTASSPERLRAVILEHLFQLETVGHCFDSLENIYEKILQHPLFYREKLNINSDQLAGENYLNHFRKRLDVVENENGIFLYLQEVRNAEKLIQNTIEKLIARHDYRARMDWVGSYLEGELSTLAAKVPKFNKSQFTSERRKLIQGALTKSFFVITGKPGSGKTIALRKVIETLRSQDEDVILLAPTGKATLRATDATKHQAQTIDRFIYQEDFGDCLDDLRILKRRATEDSNVETENVIVDESSMVDLRKLAVLIGMIKTEGKGAIKRLILIGDENQLPPIGFGKPFYDIVERLRLDNKTRNENIVRLETNCRQQYDEEVIRIADVFAGRNRYYSEMLEKLKKGGQISPGLYVGFWKDRDALHAAVKSRITEVLKEEKISSSDDPKGFNVLMGLFENGHLEKCDSSNLALDSFQVITPYNVGFYGTIGLNDFMRKIYKDGFWPDQEYSTSRFGHSDKIIRTQNWYWWEGPPWKRVLALSNGSIGVVCNNRWGRNLYFPEREDAIPERRIDDEENFDLAYAITIHKSQGSEFKHTFIVLPERRGLLYRELVYTALTRSSHKVHIFVQQTDAPEGPLEYARNRSAILGRNSSLFQEPMDAKRLLEPEPGKLVKSKIEYIIYRTLMEYRNQGKLNFSYEEGMKLKHLRYPIRTDFRVYVGDRIYFWEHLGMLDLREYSNNWEDRRQGYEKEGLFESLVTTDDISGLSQELIIKVIEDMVSGKLQGSKVTNFSNHHYRLYPD